MNIPTQSSMRNPRTAEIDMAERDIDRHGKKIIQ